MDCVGGFLFGHAYINPLTYWEYNYSTIPVCYYTLWASWWAILAVHSHCGDSQTYPIRHGKPADKQLQRLPTIVISFNVHPNHCRLLYLIDQHWPTQIIINIDIYIYIVIVIYGYQIYPPPPSAALTGYGHETQVESAAEESRQKSHPGGVSQWLFSPAQKTATLLATFPSSSSSNHLPYYGVIWNSPKLLGMRWNGTCCSLSESIRVYQSLSCWNHPSWYASIIFHHLPLGYGKLNPPCSAFFTVHADHRGPGTDAKLGQNSSLQRSIEIHRDPQRSTEIHGDP